MDQRLELYLSYLNVSVKHLQDIQSSAKLLREGAAGSQNSGLVQYRLPGALLKAFENIVMLLMFAAVSLQLADGFCKRRDHEDQAGIKGKSDHHRLLLADARVNIDTSGYEATRLIEKAKHAVMLMAHT